MKISFVWGYLSLIVLILYNQVTLYDETQTDIGEVVVNQMSQTLVNGFRYEELDDHIILEPGSNYWLLSHFELAAGIIEAHVDPPNTQIAFGASINGSFEMFSDDPAFPTDGIMQSEIYGPNLLASKSPENKCTLSKVLISFI